MTLLFRLRFALFFCLVCILLLLGTTTTEPTYASSLTTPFASSIPASQLVNPDGTLNMQQGAQGSIDLVGWHVSLDPKRGPLFTPQSPNAVGWAGLAYGVQGRVSAIVVNGSDVYVGGIFTSICGNADCSSGSLTVNNIAKWDGSSWSALGNGLDNNVDTLALSGSDIYVGGLFSVACANAHCDGSTTLNHIAKWTSGTGTWTALGAGLNASVSVLAVSGTDLYIGGGFDAPYGNFWCDGTHPPLEHIAKWNGSCWAAIGYGVDDIVGDIVVSDSGLYVGGQFLEVCGNTDCDSGNVTVNNVAKWNGSTWSSLANGVNNSVSALVLNGTDVYAGGYFTAACGNAVCDTDNVTANHIAKWDGTIWSALGNGVNDVVAAIAIIDHDVFVGGTFTALCGDADCATNGDSASYIAKWSTDTNNWAPLFYGVAGKFASGNYVWDIARSNNDLFIGGSFWVACGNALCNKNNVVLNGFAEYGPSACTSNPAKPILTTPKNDTVTTKTRPTLKWSPVSCTDSYNVTIKDAATGKKVDSTTGLAATQYKTKKLTQGKTYLWFVKACNTNGCTKSKTFKFTVN